MFCRIESSPDPLMGCGLIEVYDGHEAVWNLKAYNGRVVCSWLSAKCLELSRSHHVKIWWWQHACHVLRKIQSRNCHF